MNDKWLYLAVAINLFALSLFFTFMLSYMKNGNWWGIPILLGAAVAVCNIAFLRHAEHKMPVIIFLWCMILSAIAGLVFFVALFVNPFLALIGILLLSATVPLVLAAVITLLVVSLRQKSRVASVVNGIVGLVFVSIPLTAKYFAAAFYFLLRPFGTLASDLGATLGVEVRFIYTLSFPMLLASFAYFAFALWLPSSKNTRDGAAKIFLKSLHILAVLCGLCALQMLTLFAVSRPPLYFVRLFEML